MWFACCKDKVLPLPSVIHQADNTLNHTVESETPADWRQECIVLLMSFWWACVKVKLTRCFQTPLRSEDDDGCLHTWLIIGAGRRNGRYAVLQKKKNRQIEFLSSMGYFLFLLAFLSLKSLIYVWTARGLYACLYVVISLTKQHTHTVTQTPMHHCSWYFHLLPFSAITGSKCL